MQELIRSTSAYCYRYGGRCITMVSLCAFLAACATFDLDKLNPLQKVRMEFAYVSAEKLRNQAEYVKAAEVLWDTMRDLPPPYRERMQIKAASILVEGNFILNAFQYLKYIDETPLTASELLEKRILDAHFFTHTVQPDKVLESLPMPIIEEGSKELQITALDMRAHALSDTQDYIASVVLRIKRGDLLEEDSEEKLMNTAALWRALIAEDIEDIDDKMRDTDNSRELDAWLRLAHLATPQDIDFESLNRAYTKWSRRNAFLDLPDDLYETLTARWEYLDFAPQRIALLLPLSGNFAKLGKAIRDGFMREHTKVQATASEVLIYNTDQPNPIVQIYNKAIADGADLVVGPLLKENVENLMDQVEFTVPSIALNYHSDKHFVARGELFQFGLLPEDEATQLAKKMIQKDHLFTLVLTPDNELGKRLEQRFANEYIKRGGSIREVLHYDVNLSNYAAFVQSALRLDESNYRHRLVEETIEEKAKFVPRIRDDITAAVMFADYEKGVLIYPMVKFYYGDDLPVFSTSHVYDPTQAKLLRELDGMFYCDIPAIINRAKDEALVGKYPRLSALGEDAFHLSRMIRRIGLGNTHYEGMTGNIVLRDGSHLFRNLIWARFERGRPTSLGQGW